MGPRAPPQGKKCKQRNKVLKGELYHEKDP